MLSKSKRILVVDDQPNNIELLKAILVEKNYEVLTAKDGFEALKLLDKEKVDIVLLDIMMPEMDGYEVCQKIKDNEKTCDIPVIMVTALQDVEDRVRGLESGADDFLMKPINIPELEARIKSHLKIKNLTDKLKVREETFKMATGTNKAKETESDKFTILIAEDNPIDVLVIENFLSDQGYNFVKATNGNEALEVIEKTPVDMVILDMKMPGKDGIEVCRKIKENRDWELIPVIIVTAYGEFDKKIEALEARADDFLVKPVNSVELNARVKSLLRLKNIKENLQFQYEEAAKKAITDELTGLYNYSYFRFFLQKEIERTKENKEALSVAILDIDDFKKFNDEFGHSEGNVALKKIGEVIKNNIRKLDVAIRFGGEEFVIIFVESDIEDANLVSERLRKKIEKQDFNLTVSIGIAEFPNDADNMEDLIRVADKAMYTAKKSGKNMVCLAKDGKTSETI